MTDPPKAPESGRWQFSLRTLLVGIAFIALGCMTMVKPSFLWASFLWTSAIAVLAFAVLMVIYRSGAVRAFWVGFTFFGWGHMILAMGPWLEYSTDDFIFTRQVLDQLGQVLGYKVEHSVSRYGILQLLYFTFRDSPNSSYSYLSYVVAGQSWLTVVIAYLGGLMARYFYSTRADES